MRHLLSLSAGIACLSLVPTAWAVDTTMTPAGFTGLGLTPNAHLLDWGKASFLYDRQLPGVVAQPRGHNLVAGFGLLPNLEIGGRLATNTWDTNCFLAPCGARDLSGSVKFGIGLDSANRWRVAAGATDIGGAATYFRSYYGVVTYSEGPFEASGGLARRSGNGVNGSKSPLHGVFGSAAYQPLPWVRGHLELTDKDLWAGVRLFAPAEWLPEGWQAHVGYNARITDSNLTNRGWLSAGVTIPLYKTPALPAGGGRAPAAAAEASPPQRPLPAYEARNLPAPPPTAAQATPVAPQGSPATTPDDERLRAVAEALRAKGLEDIWVGRMADSSIAIRANNATYNWNSADALGAGLGAIARTLGTTRNAYRFVLTQRQIPLVAVTGQTDCLEQWIRAENANCPGGELSTPGTVALDPLQAGARWVVSNLQPSSSTLRVAVSPVLRTNVGTEVGALDYSLGANVGLSWPVWAGGSIDLNLQGELANSDDYERLGLFGSRRIRNGIERAAFVQTVRLPVEQWLAPGDDVKAKRWGLAAVTAQGAVGRFGHHFDGAHGTVRWEPGDGKHRVSVEGGVFRNADFGQVPLEPRTATPLLASYRYNLVPTRTYLEATAGRFMNRDHGFMLGMRQWFSDVAVQVFYRRTTNNFVGLEVSVPIGPRKDMNPNGIQVTGTQRFSHSIGTVIRERANTIAAGRGVTPPVPSLEIVHNSDRAGLLYFEDNVRRIRDAAR